MASLLKSRRGCAIRCEWNFRAVVSDAKTGACLREIKAHNLFLASGVRKIRDMLGYPVFETEGWTPAYCAVGTDGSASVSTDTALGYEVFRKAITRREAQAAGLVFYTSIGADEANGNTLREWAIFTEATLGYGEAWARVPCPDIVKSSALVVNGEWIWSVIVE